MADQHGATTIKEWLDQFVEIVRSGRDFKISAGAEPGRQYSYLEWHDEDDRHAILLFKAEVEDGAPLVRAYSFDGDSEEVRRRVDALVHGES